MPLARQAKALPELLLEQKMVSPEQLQAAQAQAASRSLPLKQMLIQQGLVTEQDLTNLLADHHGMATIDLTNYLIKPEAIQLVPESLARKQTLIPVFKIADTVTVAVADPLNFFALDEVRLKTKCEVKALLAGETAIRQAIDHYYGAAGTIKEVAQTLEAAQAPPKADGAAQETPVIQLVNLLITQATKEGASDIHLEPGEGACRTRFRIDGLLQEVTGPPQHLHSAVASRIKVLANLDIAEKRKPQDGRFRQKLEQKELDLRVSTIPTQFGEKIVLRLLDSTTVILGLEQLGFAPEVLAQFQGLIHAPNGILLVTGPTGSGKTTSLYAALSAINTVEKNILTIEDPIEYQLAGISQVQVNPKAELTFASALRAFLRQDPDVIMVGEIRDRETAEIAIQAALTGHLVLSTLHTNDASGALTRLIDMGVEPFLIASAVLGIVAQRLVRVVCPKCKTAFRPPADLLQEMPTAADAQVFRGRGCKACKQRGYKGRAGIFELLPMTETIREQVATKAASHVIRETARAAGMRTLRDDGFAKALTGQTTLEEVLRVTKLE
ncbi:MAG: Flp pilus assembly complex ATPase component TadA [Candidatus Omnitrophica bacterium]|nr:Flp pilus assembly complex ATPase component TadA [Candidatus Omnitrophota bacterium]